MNNYLDGFDRKEVTLAAMQYVEKGKTVAMAESFTVKAAGDGDCFIGVCIDVNNYNASVLLSGYVKITYSGEAPVCGFNTLSADANGGIRKDADGRSILVTDVDTAAMTCGIIL